ncbi:MAG: hypothetical protein IPN11_03375 [Opitutaceae bacterium]|nr:hypothetical protein [Opitutaceae bacterium]
MSVTALSRSLATLIFILLAGCATDDAIPADQLYRHPPAGTAQGTWIKGSKIEVSGLFAAPHLGYVLMIDGKFVLNAKENAEQPIAITPGPHEISAEYSYSVFTARTALSFEAKAGGTYVLNIKPRLEGEGERRFCDMSVVDAATGQPVSPVKSSYVTGGPSRNQSNFRPLD